MLRLLEYIVFFTYLTYNSIIYKIKGGAFQVIKFFCDYLLKYIVIYLLIFLLTKPMLGDISILLSIGTIILFILFDILQFILSKKRKNL